MNKPLISVVTPCLNAEKFIERTVESVLSQTGDFQIEYIIRDGGSTDRTLEILNKYKDQCCLISKKDNSAQEAINAGMKSASGEIGCWLNADDIFEPGAIQKVVETFKKYPDCKWVYGWCKIINENGNETRKPITWYKNAIGYFYSRNILLCVNFINQPATFWKMNLWRQVNGLSQRYKAAWDYALWLKMAFISNPKPIHEYLSSFRRHSLSISENYFIKQFNEEYKIGKQYGNFMHQIIHKINQLKIIFIYKIISDKKL